MRLWHRLADVDWQKAMALRRIIFPDDARGWINDAKYV